MASRGLQQRELLMVVLRLLERGPVADRDILDELAGRYRCTPKDVFVALAALESEDLVDADVRDRSVVYKITSGGLEATERRADLVIVEPVTREPYGRGDSGRAATHERVSVLFTDVVGSTEMFDHLGDDAAHELRRRHFALLRRIVSDFGGWEVKSLGDGLMVVFGAAGAVVGCGRAMQHAVIAGEDLVQIRIGVASGEVMRENDDYFGRPVIVARRLCDAAGAGDVLVCEDTRALVGDAAANAFAPPGYLQLKGLRLPVTASSMRLRPLALSG